MKTASVKYFFQRVFLVILIFVVIFLTKLQGYIDVSIIVLFLFFILQTSVNKNVPKEVLILTSMLLLYFFYSILISVIYHAYEIIWPLKFLRTALLIYFLYSFFYYLHKKINYQDFKNVIILCVAIHSIIIYFAILSPSFRNILYSITGYIPRGPAWSRSPGFTISFNATAIVHVTGLWFLVRSQDKNSITKLLLGLVILPSLIFLGRSMSYLGIFIILMYLLTKRPIKSASIGAIMVLLLGVIGINTVTSDVDTPVGKAYANFEHAVDPLRNIGKDGGADSYFDETLGSHLYISDDWKVLLFGNSKSGHIGLSGGKGETNSDLGIINSINANGIPITLLLYSFYLYMLFLSRKGDWQTVLFITGLSVALTFKETGFFASHVTPLLLLIVYYQIFLKQPSIKPRKDTFYFF